VIAIVAVVPAGDRDGSRRLWVDTPVMGCFPLHQDRSLCDTALTMTDPSETESSSQRGPGLMSRVGWPLAPHAPGVGSPRRIVRPRRVTGSGRGIIGFAGRARCLSAAPIHRSIRGGSVDPGPGTPKEMQWTIGNRRNR